MRRGASANDEPDDTAHEERPLLVHDSIPLDELLTNIGCGWFHTRLLWVCGLGFSAASIEIVLTAFLFVELRKEWGLTEYQLAIIPTIVGFGTISGEFFWGPIADRFGRRWVFVLTTIIVTVCGFATAFSTNIKELIAWRFMVGFGYGGNIACDFALFSEFQSTKSRGEQLFKMQAFWPLGQLITCLLAWRLIPGHGWRVFVASCALPSLITACLRPFMPESPRWLLLQGRAEEATEICRDVAVLNGKTAAEVGLRPGTFVTLEASAEGRSSSSSSSSQSSSVFTLFAPPLLWTTIGILIFAVSLHVVGYGTLTLMPTLLEAKGFPKEEKYLSMTISSAAEFPGIIIAGLLAINVGRLFPLKFSLLTTGLALSMFAAAKSNEAIMACSCMSSMFLEGGWALFHTYVPEVYPTELRATAIGAITAVSSIVSTFVPMASAYMLSSHKSPVHAILFFSTTSICGALGTSLFLNIETKDRNLQDRVHRTKPGAS